MADVFSGVSAGATSFLSGASTVVFYGFILLLILVVGIFIIYRMSFNCKVRIRYLTNGQDQCSDKTARVAKDKKDGVIKLIIGMGLFKTINMPAPPPEAISIDLKGKRCFEVEFSDDGGKRYIIKTNDQEKSELTIKNGYKPLSSNDRVFYVNEEEKRIARHQKGLSELIAQAIPYIALIVVLALVIFGWGDMVEPFNNEAASQRAYQLEWMQEASKITSMLKEIINNEQVIQGDATFLLPANISGVPPE